jgi:hypothetical protein
MAKACIKRLHALEDDSLVSAIASQPTDAAKQICLYALMKQSRLVWEFMLTVIGEKYRLRDTSFGKIDLNTFFMRLQEQNDTVASWSDSTITKLKQIIARVLGCILFWKMPSEAMAIWRYCRRLIALCRR